MTPLDQRLKIDDNVILPTTSITASHTATATVPPPLPATIFKLKSAMQKLQLQAAKNCAAPKLSETRWDKPKQNGKFDEPFFIALEGELPPFCTTLSLYAIPNWGYYCDTYPVHNLLLLLKRQSSALHKIMPAPLQDALKANPNDQIEFYFTVADMQPVLQRAGNQKARINLLYHAWLFPDIAPNQSLQQPLSMGVFTDGCQGIIQSDSGMLNCMAQQSVYPHPVNGCSICSPNNAAVTIDAEQPVTDCWTMAHNGNRWVVSYHWLICSDAIAQQMYGVLSKAQTLRQVREYLGETVSASLLDKFAALVNA